MIDTYSLKQNIMNNFHLKNLCVLVIFFTIFSGTVVSQNYSTLCNNGMMLEKAGNIDAAINKYSDAI